MQAQQYNGLCLAYIGDAIYELYVRKRALSLGLSKVNDLHHEVTRFTNANAQAEAIHCMLANVMLNDEEIAIFKRGRNSHIHTARKNVPLTTYLDATGFEALIGYLYLSNEQKRLEELISFSLDKK